MSRGKQEGADRHRQRVLMVEEEKPQNERRQSRKGEQENASKRAARVDEAPAGTPASTNARNT